MSQADLMEFFDKNPGKYFTVSELTGIFFGKMGMVAVSRNVKKVVRRTEYECRMMYGVSGGRLSSYYGRTTEETTNGIGRNGDNKRSVHGKS